MAHRAAMGNTSASSLGMGLGINLHGATVGSHWCWAVANHAPATGQLKQLLSAIDRC